MSDVERWCWAYSQSKRRAWIVNAAGFTVCPPLLTQSAAAGLVGEHNRIVDSLEQEGARS